MELKENIMIPPNSSELINLSLKFNEINLQNPELARQTINNGIIKSNNNLCYTLSNIKCSNDTYPQMQCIITNNTAEEINLKENTIIASLSSKKCSKPLKEIKEDYGKIYAEEFKNESELNKFSPDMPSIAESMDEKILEKNMIVDTTNLEKVFTWKDCEINPGIEKFCPMSEEKLAYCDKTFETF